MRLRRAGAPPRSEADFYLFSAGLSVAPLDQEGKSNDDAMDLLERGKRE